MSYNIGNQQQGGQYGYDQTSDTGYGQLPAQDSFAQGAGSVWSQTTGNQQLQQGQFGEELKRRLQLLDGGAMGAPQQGQSYKTWDRGMTSWPRGDATEEYAQITDEGWGQGYSQQPSFGSYGFIQGLGQQSDTGSLGSSQGMGSLGLSQGMGSFGLSQGMGSFGLPQDMGSLGLSQGMGSFGSSQGMGSFGLPQGMGSLGSSQGMGSQDYDGMADPSLTGYNAQGLGAGAGPTRAKKQYVQIDAQGRRTGSTFNSTSAYNAALKAASRGSTDIYLLDQGFNNGKGRVYAYMGGTDPITQHNSFTSSKGINQKARVQSRGYYDIPT